MIEVKNVVKTFDGFRALDALNITVPNGAVYGRISEYTLFSLTRRAIS